MAFFQQNNFQLKRFTATPNSDFSIRYKNHDNYLLKGLGGGKAEVEVKEVYLRQGDWKHLVAGGLGDQLASLNEVQRELSEQEGALRQAGEVLAEPELTGAAWHHVTLDAGAVAHSEVDVIQEVFLYILRAT